MEIGIHWFVGLVCFGKRERKSEKESGGFLRF